MIEVDIANVLAAQAIKIATALGLPIAMPNVPFTPPQTGMYLEVRHFRNDNLSTTWGKDKTLMGIYQISVIDLEQRGEIPATAIGSQIIDAFHKNSQLYGGSARVVIYENPTLLTTVQDGSKSIYPVSIRYRSFQAA